MSKPVVSKSRADKAGKLPAAQTPIASHEIVPGKFNDHDWNLMIDRDGSEDFVEDIVDDLIGNTLDKCFDLYIQRQLIPFTVSEAKDALLSIIEWRFLTRDEGEKNPESDPGWIQDEEPDPAETDCWAQGSVPRTFLPSPVPEPIIEEPEENQEMQVEEETAEKDVVLDEEPELEDQVSEDETAGREEAERLAKEEQQRKAAEAEKKKKKKFKPYTGRMRSPGLKVTESLEQTEMSLLTQEIIASMPPPQEKLTGLVTMPASCHSILKVQAGRPPGNKDVEYDDYGNVVAVIKLNPEKLPNHRIKVNYQVVDPAVEAAQARLEAMKTGRYVAPRPKRRVPKKVETSESITDVPSKVSTKTPLPPPMIETMEVSPGVTIKEGGRVKQGPARYIRRVDMMSQTQKNLKPVSVSQNTPRLDVSDILDRTTPILRPIHDNSPLPPIMAIPHPPEKPKLST